VGRRGVNRAGRNPVKAFRPKPFFVYGYRFNFASRVQECPENAYIAGVLRRDFISAAGKQAGDNVEGVGRAGCYKNISGIHVQKDW
jgi:hypothetical protein